MTCARLNIGEIGKKYIPYYHQPQSEAVADGLAVNMCGFTMGPLNISLHLFLEDYFNCQGQFTCPSAVFRGGLAARDLAEGRCFALGASL